MSRSTSARPFTRSDTAAGRRLERVDSNDSSVAGNGRVFPATDALPCDLTIPPHKARILGWVPTAARSCFGWRTRRLLILQLTGLQPLAQVLLALRNATLAHGAPHDDQSALVLRMVRA
jgi:hypothetical protein